MEVALPNYAEMYPTFDAKMYVQAVLSTWYSFQALYIQLSRALRSTYDILSESSFQTRPVSERNSAIWMSSSYRHCDRMPRNIGCRSTPFPWFPVRSVLTLLFMGIAWVMRRNQRINVHSFQPFPGRFSALRRHFSSAFFRFEASVENRNLVPCMSPFSPSSSDRNPVLLWRRQSPKQFRTKQAQFCWGCNQRPLNIQSRTRTPIDASIPLLNLRPLFVSLHVREQRKCLAPHTAIRKTKTKMKRRYLSLVFLWEDRRLREQTAATNCEQP